MKEDIYELYKRVKLLIKAIDDYKNIDPISPIEGQEYILDKLIRTIKIFDEAGSGYKERYEKEMSCLKTGDSHEEKNTEIL